jgi:hypothetical protein
MLREIDRYAISCTFHDSYVGHFGITKTLQAMSLAGHETGEECRRMLQTESSNAVSIKEIQGVIDHHLYSLKPLASLSIETLGPLSVDDRGYRQ